MTHSQALTQVEFILTDLEEKDSFGDPLVGIEAVGVLWKYHGKVWDEVERMFFMKEIDPETYVTSTRMLADEVKRLKHREKVEKLLADLRGKT